MVLALVARGFELLLAGVRLTTANEPSAALSFLSNKLKPAHLLLCFAFCSHRRALSAPAPGSAAALPQLLRWAVAARLAQLRRMQQQWVAAQAGAPAAPEPAQQQAPLFELEASAVLLQLSQGAGANNRQQAATAAASQPRQPEAEGHAAAAVTAAMLPPPPRRHAAAPPSGAEQPPAKRRRSAC